MFYRRIVALLFLTLFCRPAFALEIGDPVPPFALPSLSTGEAVDISAYKGKVVYVDFWASWCVPCRVSFPLIEQVYQQKNAEGLEVIAINVDENIKDAHKFLRKRPVSFTLVRDAQGVWPEMFGVQKMPSSYIVDKQGKIAYIHYGFHPSDMDEINRVVNQLLEK